MLYSILYSMLYSRLYSRLYNILYSILCNILYVRRSYAGVLNVRAKRLRACSITQRTCPSNVPPRVSKNLEKLFLTSRAPPTCPPKVWQNCFSPAVPPPKSGKNCFSPIFGMVGWWCHMRSTNSALRADNIQYLCIILYICIYLY